MLSKIIKIEIIRIYMPFLSCWVNQNSCDFMQEMVEIGILLDSVHVQIMNLAFCTWKHGIKKVPKVEYTHIFFFLMSSYVHGDLQNEYSFTRW